MRNLNLQAEVQGENAPDDSSSQRIAASKGYIVDRSGSGRRWHWENATQSKRSVLTYPTKHAAWLAAADAYLAHTFLRTAVNHPILLQMPGSRTEQALPFVVQPIAHQADLTPFGYEILYRGKHPAQWKTIDGSMLKFLSQNTVHAPLFINQAVNQRPILSTSQRPIFSTFDAG